MIATLLIAAAAAGLTFAAGWWGVAVVALVAGLIFSHDGGRPWRVALGATAGWVLLLLLDMTSGRFGRVATVVSGSMSISAVALLGVTLLLPALLGWSGATVGAAIGQVTTSARRGTPDVM